MWSFWEWQQLEKDFSKNGTKARGYLLEKLSGKPEGLNEQTSIELNPFLV